MARPLRAQVWHDVDPVPDAGPAEDWSAITEPWRHLKSSSVIRFIGKRGGELNVDDVDPQKRGELLSALEARHMLGGVYSSLKRRNFAAVTKDQQKMLDLLGLGFIEVRQMKNGEFRVDVRSRERKARFTVQEFYSKVFELTRLA